MRKINNLSLLSILAILAVFLTTQPPPEKNSSYSEYRNTQKTAFSQLPSPNIISTPTPPPLPKTKILDNDYHVFQTFNNCGPASLSMVLSYYGIEVSQKTLGDSLRPYQNPQGNNDDKSVTLSELGNKAEEYGFTAYHRPNGNIEKIKLFISNDIPIVARTLTKVGEDIGHYRVVKGYNDILGYLIQDDSLQGKNLNFTYDEFLSLWKAFNYEYLVLAQPEDKRVVEQVLKDDLDPKTAWRKASQLSRNLVRKNPNDIYAKFNLSVALYNIGNFKSSIEIFEEVENQIPFRTLWYNIEPILAYYEVGDYGTVFEITDNILNNHNRAFSELYLTRGDIYKKQGAVDAARNEFEKAVLYNINLQKAKEALESVK